MHAVPPKPPRAVWSDAELHLLEKETAKPNYKAGLLDLILTNRPVFHWSRTLKGLENHSYKLRSKSGSKATAATSSQSPSTLKAEPLEFVVKFSAHSQVEQLGEQELSEEFDIQIDEESSSHHQDPESHAQMDDGDEIEIT